MQTRPIIMISASIVVALSLVAYAALEQVPDSPPPQTRLSGVAYTAPETPEPDTVVETAMAPVQQAEAISELLISTDTDTVFGLEVRADRTCSLVERYMERVDGTMMRGVECIPAEKPPGPYDLYDYETLLGMSYAEAGAAQELGERYHEDHPEFARTMMLRAAALDPTNTLPLRSLAGLNYGRTAYNGEPDLNQLQENYVLQKVADLMTGDAHPEWPRKHLEAAGFTEQRLASLDVIANDEMQKIRDIQLEVTGFTTIQRTDQ